MGRSPGGKTLCSRFGPLGSDTSGADRRDAAGRGRSRSPCATLPRSPLVFNRPDHVDTDRLREWLSEVHEGETTAALMLAVAYDRGIGASEPASWYGRSTESVEETIAALDSPATS